MKNRKIRIKPSGNGTCHHYGQKDRLIAQEGEEVWDNAYFKYCIKSGLAVVCKDVKGKPEDEVKAKADAESDRQPQKNQGQRK